jgi:flagellar hook-basal body complex protein FliE
MIVGQVASTFFTGQTGGAGLGSAGGASSASALGGMSFSDMLANAAGTAVNTLRGAEEMSVKGLQGEGDTRAVVDAVMGAEQALQAAVAIRDKIVTAYLEISRMQI